MFLAFLSDVSNNSIRAILIKIQCCKIFNIFSLSGNFPLNQLGLCGIYWEILKCCLKEKKEVLKNKYHNASIKR